MTKLTLSHSVPFLQQVTDDFEKNQLLRVYRDHALKVAFKATYYIVMNTIKRI